MAMRIFERGPAILVLFLLVICVTFVVRGNDGVADEKRTLRLLAQVDGANHFIGIVANNDDLKAIEIIPGDIITVEPLSTRPFRAETWYQTWSWTEDRKDGKTTIHDHIQQPATKSWDLAWGSSLDQVLHLADVSIRLGKVDPKFEFRPKASSTRIKNYLDKMQTSPPKREVPKPPRAPSNAQSSALTPRCPYKNNSLLVTVTIHIQHAAPQP